MIRRILSALTRDGAADAIELCAVAVLGVLVGAGIVAIWFLGGVRMMHRVDLAPHRWRSDPRVIVALTPRQARDRRAKLAAGLMLAAAFAAVVVAVVAANWGGVVITEPGAYLGIAAEDYHGREICPAPSISATGIKCIVGKSPLHYWYGSDLNPDRPARVEKRHFSVGKAAHDKLLLGERWPAMYHVLPENFDRRASKRCADDIARADDAEAAGLTVLRHEDALAVEAMATALRSHPFACAALSNGEPEVTLAWQDAETGVWLRARPDFLPTRRKIIPDLKTAADGSPDGFSRAIGAFGYHIAAAHYLAGIEAVFGERPTNWLHVVIEKEPPHVVSVYPLPQEDIDRGEDQRRRAIRIFADCLNSGKWPGYTNPDPAAPLVECGLPAWARKQADIQMEEV